MEHLKNDLRTLSLDASDCDTNSEGPVESFLKGVKPNLPKQWHNDDNSVLDLSRRNVSSIPKDAVKDEALITTLNLSWNPGISLKSILGKLVNVVKLSLVHCALESLPDEICNLTKLEVVDLSGNHGLLLSSWLTGISQLKVLRIEDCNLKKLPEELRSLENLEELDISHNPAIKVMPAEVLPVNLKNLRAVCCGLTQLRNLENLCKVEEFDASKNTYLNSLPCEIAMMKSLKKLCMSYCSIHLLPVEIGQLQKLEELDLRGNKTLSCLPAAVGMLYRLKRLTIAECGLLELIPEIAALSALEELNVSDNDALCGLPCAIGSLPKLRRLSVSRCGIRSLPEEIGQLVNLEELLLAGNTALRSLDSSLAHLCRLRTLDISRCSLILIPDWLGNLQMLEELLMHGNANLESLNRTIAGLKRLKRLDVSQCSLNSIPDWFADLSMLEELLLFGNTALRSLSSTVGRFSGLAKLDISMCSLNAIPDAIGNLDMLEELLLGGNKDLSCLNPSLSRLSQLKKLDVSQCSLALTPDWLCDLEMLEELLLAGNTSLQHLCPAIGNLSRLAKLDISSCSLATIPDSLGDLDSLTELNLSNNQLQDYPICTIRLKSLRRLDLSTSDSCSIGCENTGSSYLKGNRIKELPVELAFSNLLELKLSGNPITVPPLAVWTNGLVDIKLFMRDCIPGGERMLADTINIVGDAGAGKTSVACSLVARSPRPTQECDRTRVMQHLRMRIDESSGQSVMINDIGGREIYYSIMPTFLPTSGLFIIVFDMTSETQEVLRSVKRWLFTVIAKSRDVRVIIVGTHADKLARKERFSLEEQIMAWLSSLLHSALDDNNNHIRRLESQQKNNGVESLKQLRNRLQRASICVVMLSCLVPDEGLASLRDLVVNALRPPEYLPVHWYRFISEMCEQDAYSITMDQVELIAKAVFGDEYKCQTLKIILRYLAKTSQILWFEDHMRLRNFIFPSPQKIIDTCKKILHHESNLISFKNEIEQYEQGLLSEPLLRMLMHEVHEEPFNRSQEHAVSFSQNFEVLVDLMLQFNIIGCVTTDTRGRMFIVPCKLRPDVPSSFQLYTQIEESCVNRIAVHLSFLLSVVPLSFFETSLSSMLMETSESSWVVTWKNGLTFSSSEVYFVSTLYDDVITLTAFSKSPVGNPWIVLRRILSRLNDNNAMSWHGAQSRCAIECPGCGRYCQSDNHKLTVGMIEVELHTLAACDSLNDLRLTCSYCMKTIPHSLCLPTTACEQKRSKTTESENSRKRKMMQSRKLKSLKRPESETSRKRKNTPTTVSDNPPVGACSKLVDRLTRNMSRLIDGLTESIVLIVAIDLFTGTTPGGSGIITLHEMELIKEKTTSHDMALELLNTVCSRGDSAIEQLIVSLRSARVARPDLADLLHEPSFASEQGHANPDAHQ